MIEIEKGVKKALKKIPISWDLVRLCMSERLKCLESLGFQL